MLSVFIICSLLATAGLTLGFGLCTSPAELYKPVLLFIGCFAAINVLYVLSMGVLSLFVKPEPLKKQYRLCRAVCAATGELLSAYVGVRLTVNGKELIPTDSRFLFISNHRSMFDPLTVMDKLRSYNISFVSKPSNLKIPIVGTIAKGAGFLSINRENDREALKTILTAADYLKRDICSIGIYPEGTRSKSLELLPFHAGSFKIAQRSNVPIVLACISGTEKVKKNFPFRRTNARMDILTVIPAGEVKAKSTVELAELCRTLIEKRLTEIEGERA